MNQARPDIGNVIERTVHIRTSIDSGTSFAIEHEDHQYLVTAKHVISNGIDGVRPEETIRLYTDDRRMMVASVQRPAASGDEPNSGGVDVAVLELSQRISFAGNSPAIGRPEDLFVTQNISMASTEHLIAFGTDFGITTRTGTIAKIVNPNNRGAFTGDFLVDIEAYHGFSGSPVIYCDSEGQARLVGVAARMSWRTIPTFGAAPVPSGLIGCLHIQRAIGLLQTLD